MKNKYRLLLVLLISINLGSFVYAGFVQDTNKEYSKQNYRQGVKLLTEAAEQGLPEAKLMLGVMHLAGRVGNKKTVKRIEKSTKQKYVTISYRKFCKKLGKAYKNKEFGLLNSLVHDGINQNNACAQYYLGLMHHKGNGIDKNYDEAVKWYEKSKEQGFSRAWHALSDMYGKGDGVPYDFQKSISLASGALSGQNPPNIPVKVTVYESNKPSKETLERYAGLAIKGNAIAQYNLGEMYYHGEGVHQDYKQAVKWFTKAAKQGHAKAQYNLGVIYRQGDGVQKDYKQAVKWYIKSAEQGHAKAQHNLGLMYKQGEGVKQDYDKAVKWLTKAAEQGVAEAPNHLGWMYEQGEGVQQDYKQAFEWYTKAAEQGEAYAQYSLGRMYAHGKGVQHDDKQAVKWYTKAAEQGHAESQAELAKIIRDLPTIEEAIKDHKAKDYKSAFDKFLKLVEKGDAIAQNWLATMHYHGEGIEVDFEKSAKFFSMSAKQGNAYGQHNLGLMYFYGDLGKKDTKKGLMLITKAAKQGHVKAKKFLDELNKQPLNLAGTGFVVTKNGVIATAQHVVDNCKKIEVDGLEANIIISDKINDIALIKVNRTYRDIASIKMRSPKLGTDIMVFGYPLSDKLSSTHISLTKGSVSSLSGLNSDTSRFRYTAASQPGNSGGAIVNNKGRVVGVVSAVMKNDKESEINRQNLNFGVRSSLLVNLMDSKNIPVVSNEIPKEEIIGHYEKVTKYIECFK